VTASYVLGEIPSKALRETALLALWQHTADVLVGQKTLTKNAGRNAADVFNFKYTSMLSIQVLIEPGTPEGFGNILQARELFLSGPSTNTSPAAAATLRAGPRHIVAPVRTNVDAQLVGATWLNLLVTLRSSV